MQKRAPASRKTQGPTARATGRRATAKAAKASSGEPAAFGKPGRPSMKGEVLRRAILETAVTLFIQRGTAGTSIQDIAESLGLTRTAVYYYFRKKEDILQALSEEVTLSARRIGASVMARGDFDVVATLRDLVQQHAAVIMSHPQGFRVIERNERELSDEHVRAAQGARRAIFENFRAVIERGISSGRFRVVDADVAAFALIGMCNWTAWWFQPGGRMKAEEVSGAIADMAVHALMREDARVARTPDVWESFRLLREDLSYLERQLKVISKS